MRIVVDLKGFQDYLFHGGDGAVIWRGIKGLSNSVWVDELIVVFHEEFVGASRDFMSDAIDEFGRDRVQFFWMPYLPRLAQAADWQRDVVGLVYCSFLSRTCPDLVILTDELVLSSSQTVASVKDLSLIAPVFFLTSCSGTEEVGGDYELIRKSAENEPSVIAGIEFSDLLGENLRAALAGIECELAPTVCREGDLNAPQLASVLPKLAYVSPLPPQRTGIARYSADLLSALAKFYEIYAITESEIIEEVDAETGVLVRDAKWFATHSGEFERVVYHFGNSPFHAYMVPLLRQIPGVVVLHDYYLSGLLEWMESHGGYSRAWAEALYYSHGYAAIKARAFDCSSAVDNYPSNFQVLQGATDVIVHSQYSAQLAATWYGTEVGRRLRDIPLLRVPAESDDPGNLRRELGFAEDDFIVCSFGFVARGKLHDRILAAWELCGWHRDAGCKLVFVGDNDEGIYGLELKRRIDGLEGCRNVSIHGYASDDTYRKYLMVADVAVQLRGQTRGETSAAVLDCMNFGVATVVNAVGSMAEIDRNAVWMLPGEFCDGELVQALIALRTNSELRSGFGRCGRDIIRERHTPAQCAIEYRNVIEESCRRVALSSPRIVEKIGEIVGGVGLSDPEVRTLAKAISAPLNPRPSKRRLYVDVSATIRLDLKTGIQRVVRAICLGLLERQLEEYRVELVYLSDSGGEWNYRYARQFSLELLGVPTTWLRDDVVEPTFGDVFLGLDFASTMLVAADDAGLIERFKRAGVTIWNVVYDLLPVQMPKMFPQGTSIFHERWLESVARCDGALCISRSVAKDFEVWLRESRKGGEDLCLPVISWFHLGADVVNSAPTVGLPKEWASVVEQMKVRPTFLMVGTVEPRKGHAQALDAFDLLLKRGCNANLAIVGKAGWMTEELVGRMQAHPENGKRFFWFEGASDEFLDKIYSASSCLLAASYGEGFGLPLVEAAKHGIPILARDIAVFREVGGGHASFFDAQSDEDLAAAMEEWLELHKAGGHPASSGLPWITWNQSADQVLGALGLAI